MRSHFMQYFARGWVCFIFLHKSLLYRQERKEDVGEKVCARNSESQDDELVAPCWQQPEFRCKRGQVGETADTPALPRRRGSRRRGSAVAGYLLAVDSCEVLVHEPLMPPTPRSTADCRPHCVARAWS